jgi:hypothetical protein
VRERTEKQDSHITWLWRTIIGAGIVGFVGGIIGIVFWALKGGTP